MSAEPEIEIMGPVKQAKHPYGAVVIWKGIGFRGEGDTPEAALISLAGNIRRAVNGLQDIRSRALDRILGGREHNGEAPE